MTDILKLARDTGLFDESQAQNLQRFADLIREDERTKLLGASVEAFGWVRTAKEGPGVYDPMFLLGESVPTGYVSGYIPLYTAEALAARVAWLHDELNRLDVLLEECKMDWSGDVAQLKAEHARELTARVAQAQVEQREKDAVKCDVIAAAHGVNGRQSALWASESCAAAIRAGGKEQSNDPR